MIRQWLPVFASLGLLALAIAYCRDDSQDVRRGTEPVEADGASPVSTTPPPVLTPRWIDPNETPRYAAEFEEGYETATPDRPRFEPYLPVFLQALESRGLSIFVPAALECRWVDDKRCFVTVNGISEGAFYGVRIRETTLEICPQWGWID
jgi:hypothetical protein